MKLEDYSEIVTFLQELDQICRIYLDGYAMRYDIPGVNYVNCSIQKHGVMICFYTEDRTPKYVHDSTLESDEGKYIPRISNILMKYKDIKGEFNDVIEKYINRCRYMKLREGLGRDRLDELLTEGFKRIDPSEAKQIGFRAHKTAQSEKGVYNLYKLSGFQTAVKRETKFELIFTNDVGNYVEWIYGKKGTKEAQESFIKMTLNNMR